jgi:hypothetical protein
MRSEAEKAYMVRPNNKTPMSWILINTPYKQMIIGNFDHIMD